MGMTQGSTGMNFLKGGLTGLSQGLANYGNPHPTYDFSQLAAGFRANRPAIGDGATPNAKRQKAVGGQTNSIDNPQSSRGQDDDQDFLL